ncbi:hypothetical protein FPANT_10208 [Fusarium pseudoanthophilum]|uniref:CBM-cenC domain-containing protein n=1 Tax=Fusarium pseudoanthophilum TaxID=48495 RepID=A0A8H5NW45_9HYPO|nr:hypothetical protein FPANT_10208 [Fusarium pseudoanthophilum]
MRFTHPALLLALCQIASASPCKPSSSVTSRAPTSTENESASSATEISTAISGETGSSTVSHDTTLTASETISTSDLSVSTTLVSTSSAEPTTTLETTTTLEATTTIEATTDLSTPVDETTTTFESETSATLISTTTAEASTTTAAEPEIPSNRILNPGFEDALVYPWESMAGSLGKISSGAHSGSQAGSFAGNTPMSAMQGVRQFIEPTWITPGKSYKFSAWVKLTMTVGCGSPTIVCGHGMGQGATGLGGTIEQTGDYSLASVTCSWTQAQWEARPSVQVRGYCTNLSFFVDDATLEEVETLG